MYNIRLYIPQRGDTATSCTVPSMTRVKTQSSSEGHRGSQLTLCLVKGSKNLVEGQGRSQALVKGSRYSFS